MGNIIKAGGTAGQSASFTVDDTGAVTVTDASGTSLLTLSSAAALAIGALTATGNVALGDAATDTIAVTGALTVTGLMAFTAQTVTVDANKTLTYGTPTGSEVKVTSNVLLMNNTTASSKDVTMPATAGLANRLVFIFNVSSQPVVIKNASASTLATLAAGKGTILGSDGSGIGVITGA